MLEIVQFENTNQIYSFDFLKEDYQTIKTICPSPVLADVFRKKSKRADLEVITINKFLKDLNTSEKEIVKKTKLFLTLSKIWKQYFSEDKYETFLQSFNLLTELRSFTLDFSQVLEILEDRDEDMAKAVKVFWMEMIKENIIDEHQVLKEIRDNLNESKKEALIFWGFNHINAGQVDFIKDLSLIHDVYIPLPNTVLKTLRNSDWPMWLTTELEAKESETSSPKINVHRFSKNRLNEELLKFSKDNNLNGAQVFLSKKNPEFKELNEIPFNHIHFRCEADIFKNILSDEIKRLERSYFSDSKEIELSEIISDVENKYKELQENFSINNARAMKVYLFLVDHLNNYKEDEIGKKFTHFDLKVMEYIVGLSLPRNYNIPLENEYEVTVKGLESIFDYDTDATKIICVTSEYSRIKKGHSPYDPNMVNILSNLGPLMSSDFEYQMNKFYLKEILSQKNAHLFIENLIEEQDVGWEEILNELEIIPYKEKGNYAKTLSYYAQKRNEAPKEEVLKLSPTKLQTFLDCPQKFYYQYILKMREKVSLGHVLLPFQLGNIEHKVIETYLNENTSWDKENHKKIINSQIREALDGLKIQLEDFYFQKYFIEIRDYTKNVIRELLKFNTIKDISFGFEKPIGEKINNVHFGGQLDLLIRTPFGAGVLDFKRGSSSVPSDTDILNYKKIQITYYLSHYKIKGPLNFWGYLCEADLGKSRIYCSSEEVKSSLLELSFLNGKVIEVIERDSFLEGYSHFEKEMIQKIIDEKEFRPIPESSSSCKYCWLNNICPKGDL